MCLMLACFANAASALDRGTTGGLFAGFRLCECTDAAKAANNSA